MESLRSPVHFIHLQHLENVFIPKASFLWKKVILILTYCSHSNLQSNTILNDLMMLTQEFSGEEIGCMIIPISLMRRMKELEILNLQKYWSHFIFIFFYTWGDLLWYWLLLLLLTIFAIGSFHCSTVILHTFVQVKAFYFEVFCAKSIYIELSFIYLIPAWWALQAGMLMVFIKDCQPLHSLHIIEF